MLGTRLRSLRKANNLGQDEIAKRLSVTKQTVSNWENGNAVPSIELLLKLASLFSVSTDYLLGLDDRRYVEVSGLSETDLAFLQRMIFYIRAGQFK